MSLCRCGAPKTKRQRRCSDCAKAARLEHSARGHVSYETMEAQARHRRMAEILAKEPTLESWQLAERLGLTEEQATDLRTQLKRRRALRQEILT